jgi:hypothetical protein
MILVGKGGFALISSLLQANQYLTERFIQMAYSFSISPG